MAAAEARIIWQRTANRLQEDAKRAPKLSACCQSSSAMKQAEVGPTGPDHLSSVPTKTDSYSNSSRDSKWWLNTQPDYGYRKGFTYEQLNALESEDGNVKSSGSVLMSRTRESHKRKCDASTKSLGSENGRSSGARKRAGSAKILEEEIIGISDAKKHEEMSFEPEFGLLGSEKSEPWWRMADRDELVSLVARRTLNHFENCDLPPPQKTCHGRTPFSQVGHFDDDNTEILQPERRTQEKIAPDEALRCENTKDIEQDREGESRSKARLMEALCHSQMRAREAEKAAERAYAEREHIVTLFFRQASLLFAYRHWFRLLQLETLCLRIKSGRGDDDDDDALFPLPFQKISSSELDRDKNPMKKNRLHDRERSSHDMSATYAAAFTLGLSLVGAGLLLGWTVGWMFPRF